MLRPARELLRLYRRNYAQSKRFNQARASKDQEIKQNYEDQSQNKKFKLLLKENKDKITFNSYLDQSKLELGYYKYYVREVKRTKNELANDRNRKSLPPLPLSLQYLVEDNRLLKENNEELSPDPVKNFQLPFGSTTQVEFNEKIKKPSNNQNAESNPHKKKYSSEINKWMTNYEYFDDTKLSTFEVEECDEIIEDEWGKQYGTPDTSVPVSRVPCGGCGALLHCSDPAIPGYLPSEIFKNRDQAELKTMECQRCHFLKEYNIALDVMVHPAEYEKLLQSIRNVKSLVVLMIDLLDFPCSIWPGIIDIIGTDRPIIIVGNKVDLLPGDSIGYLKRIRESLMIEINKTKLGEANVKHVSLISAKTGYGVEDLISVMFKTWLYKGDVFLVGCTNVGKSSLFNALLQSDYCKAHAADIVKRATVSKWPGTTLNLLKFPINRPSGWKIQQRSKRLKKAANLIKVEKEIRNAQLDGKIPTEAPALIGHIGRSFTEFHSIDGDEILEKKMLVMDEQNNLFKKSKWFYDTPGVIHPDQVLSLLSTEELLLTIPKQLIRPQTYYVNEGTTIFIGGLARIDLVKSDAPCRFTIFCADTLPLTVTETEVADEVYAKFVGTELFAVPSGGEERLSKWPGMRKCEKELVFVGGGPKVCCGDVVLSSVAWAGVTAKPGVQCRVAAWTPEARGVYKRESSVLPYSINLKGKRVRDTPAYMIGKVFSEEE